jgi:hypothetical protein
MYVTALAIYVGSVLNYVCGIRDFHQRHEWQTVASGAVLVTSATSGRMLHLVAPARPEGATKMNYSTNEVGHALILIGGLARAEPMKIYFIQIRLLRSLEWKVITPNILRL